MIILGSSLHVQPAWYHALHLRKACLDVGNAWLSMSLWIRRECSVSVPFDRDHSVHVHEHTCLKKSHTSPTCKQKTLKCTWNCFKTLPQFERFSQLKRALSSHYPILWNMVDECLIVFMNESCNMIRHNTSCNWLTFIVSCLSSSEWRLNVDTFVPCPWNISRTLRILIGEIIVIFRPHKQLRLHHCCLFWLNRHRHQKYVSVEVTQL